MHVVLLFLVKFSICLAMLWLFYKLVLSRLTFYNWNRIYLLLCPVLSFMIAFLDIGPLLRQNSLATTGWLEWVPAVRIEGAIAPTQSIEPAMAARWTVQESIMGIILAGVVLMALRFATLLLSVRKMIRQATFFSDNGLRFYQVEANIAPFSFSNAIFLNRALHDADELQKIIQHESVHIRQKHSIDILWSELLCILNWYNPFVWLLKKAVRQNLEFIADDQVLKTGVDREQYQYSLLRVAGNRRFSITNNFNFSALRNRIIMMNKHQSAGIHSLKFMLLFPLAATLLLAFRKNGPVPFMSPKLENSFFIKAAALADSLSVAHYSPVPLAIGKRTSAASASASPERKTGFTGIQGIVRDSGKPGEDLSPRFAVINGQYYYYTQQAGEITYYNRNGQTIDRTGKLISNTRTNASEVLPNQYIYRVYKDGEIISSFNDDKAWADR